MIPSSYPVHSVSVVPPTLQQPTATHENYPSNLALFGWGAILILTILSCQHLIILLHQKYRSRRSIVLLQRQAVLERLLAYKRSPKQVFERNKSQ